MKRKPWTPEQIRTLTARYPETPTQQIADDIGRTLEQCYHKAHQLGLHKSAEFRSSDLSGRTNGSNKGAGTRFAPGQTPWNKGTSYNAGGRSASQARSSSPKLSGWTGLDRAALRGEVKP